MMTIAQTRPLPTTIADYLAQLRQALAGADPAMVQDALYDAEEYLRAELAEQSGKSEAEVIAGVAGSYGAPEEVAEIYRETEVTVSRALRPPLPPKRPSLIGKFFGVAADPRTYGALFYMLLSLLTGVFYFTWVVTGVSLSLGLLILIIGVPLLVLFFGSVRVLSLVEGRLVETLLGVRMPRRPRHPGVQDGWLQRVAAMFTDVRTWSTLLYFVLMLPLGIVYFTLFTTLLSVSLTLTAAPLALFFEQGMSITWGEQLIAMPLMVVPLSLLGVLLLFVTLHAARGMGTLHGMLAKHLLVRSGDLDV
ncbi:sensor domain-containing protein [Xanthomonas vesicatoria]|uniref:sensor domain-containing protein n=1 Tax=Xanthomonas vesicatoria TaxID=56460 RepID=UPI001E383ABF|nr:sensor domain-containing protein [Xanthomonas vesicatoria]MCC8617241.1 sensor domain-containing protein [Xanthomonas vesicatoria]MCC8629364.1 sensor domain-containing protein [Xanthomonas vesicatoria]